jgi:hypothetical protein
VLTVDAATLVDAERYPFDDPDVIATHRRELDERGVSVLPGFVHEAGVARLVEEADALAPLAYHQDVQGTPYLERPDVDAFPDPSHPRRALSRSSVHVVAYDQHPPESLLRALYEWDDLLAFLGRVLGREPLHRYADPLGALNLAVMHDGDVLGWHYDQTDFVVSLAIQSSETGGDFENVANLRADGDERYDEVAAVLRDEAPDLVVVEPMTPGTLMLFEGRRSLHRVTPIGGTRPRHVALLGYDTKPGTRSTEALQRTRYGRVDA